MKATNTTAPVANQGETRSRSFVARRVDLRAERRARFIKGAQRQINRLNKFQIEPSSRDWFELLDEVDRGSIRGPKCIASLRNGSKAMPLSSEGATHVSFDTTFDAVTFYVEAIHACRNGELDEVLAATSGKVERA